jgi:ketosteroid isomerase-like protein
MMIALPLIVLTLPGVARQAELQPPALAEMVKTERAFATLGEERGFRESFMTYFAEEGIAFGPHPYRAKETLSRQPAPAKAPPIGFKWAPAFGDIAQAGDLGWDTGPVVFDTADPNKKRHGMFFSVWKKQSNGEWRVVLDMGSDTPEAVVPLNAPFQSSYRPSKRTNADANSKPQIESLLNAEREFLAAAKSRSVAQAYTDHASDDVRVHRPGSMPVVGKTAVRRWLTVPATTLSGEPIKADVSASADLGYAYGRYEVAGGEKGEKGYYGRVWKREPGGPWRIVMDAVNAIPPEKPR